MDESHSIKLIKKGQIHTHTHTKVHTVQFHNNLKNKQDLPHVRSQETDYLWKEEKAVSEMYTRGFWSHVLFLNVCAGYNYLYTFLCVILLKLDTKVKETFSWKTDYSFQTEILMIPFTGHFYRKTNADCSTAVQNKFPEKCKNKSQGK